MARYKCRGYESEMRLRWSSMVPQASVVMRKYLGLNTDKYVDPTLPPE
ncbi:hypothetical protein [Paenibacillus xylanivorans]|nr:hypothetical protein [Paenibacillus xylanivorans]